MELYRPINNLITLDKIIEDDINTQMTEYFEDNKIICDNPYGSRASHRTDTACSVIQGSKLSSLLYTIYTNEIPQLYRLMDKTNYTYITNDTLTNDYKTIQHETINYVDESTNIISTNNFRQIQQNINGFYKLLETYYDINKLKINADKSKILIICKPIPRQNTDKI